MATWTFHEYLRKYANIHVSWDHRQLVLPNPLPKVENFTLDPPDLIRFYQNPCLYGYSFAFWPWSPKWSDHLDWIALNGINLVLAPSGQEMIWTKTYEKLGVPRHITQQYHFTGKAFLPWHRMGNLKQWAGPLSLEAMAKDVALQHQILERVLSLGITPAIPAFNGVVPDRIRQLFPNETYYPLRLWGNFPPALSGLYYLMPSSWLFQEIQRTFFQLYTEEYGNVTHFFAFDTFNEMSPPSEDPDFLRQYGHDLMASLIGLDAKAIWVMQGWMFLNDTYWTVSRSKALLESLDPNHVLILDLSSPTNPQYTRLESYYGRPFVFCMLHNYGGTSILYGKADTINKAPYEARQLFPSHYGMGLTPEGIHNSYVMYELMMETFSRTRPFDDLPEWFANYTHRRYGLFSAELEESWTILGSSVYNCCEALPPMPKPFRFHGKTTFTQMPRVSHTRIGYPRWYKVKRLFQAWQLMISAAAKAKNCETLDYDLVALTREVLDSILDHQYLVVMRAFFKNETMDFINETKLFLDVVHDMEKVLSTNGLFMLGPYLEEAKNYSTKAEFMARNIITLWGPQGNILDYARRIWSGLVEDYYLPRWALFFELLLDSMRDKGNKYVQRKFRKRFLLEIGIPFTKSKKKYPTMPQLGTLEVVNELFEKWSHYRFNNSYQRYIW